MNDERHNTREGPTDFPWNLIEDITNGFAVEQKIGSGGYGVVYKVWLMIFTSVFSVSSIKKETPVIKYM
jgi:hypothetical protein